MSRVFIDPDLLTWEAYASGGHHGLPYDAKVVFLCRSDPMRRASYVRLGKDSMEAERAVLRMSDDELRELLADAEPIE
jgi:hypothetical protein